MNISKDRIVLLSLLCLLNPLFCTGQIAKIKIFPDSLKARVSPSLHGIFFEEISHGGEGGLYAELIQNRGFEDSQLPQGCMLDSGWLVPPRTPHYSLQPTVSDWKMEWKVKNDYPAWSLLKKDGAEADIFLSDEKPLTPASPHSLKVVVGSPGKGVSLVNEGFWGINVVKGETYKLSFYIRTNKSYKGPFVATLETEDREILASHTFNENANYEWKKFECNLQATGSYAKARLCLSFQNKGEIWVDFVSLFPSKTFKNRPNGMRVDLAEYLQGLKPAFVRWPGGCYVEGINVQSAPDWKRTIGRLEDRPGTYSPWGYWSSDGFGYHEFLQFCEDIGAKALYVFNCGVSCDYRSGTFVPDDSVGPYIQSALDAIEYAIGSVESHWGALRAKNGHPAPFPLHYVEVGNEQVGKQYGERFNMFYKAIKEKFPEVEVIASMGIAHINKATTEAIKKMDIADEHTYKSIYWPMVYHDWYDKYPRKDYGIYIGEYSCNGGVGKGNMMAALNDAASVLMYERNSDLITMTSYAPLLENVNSPHWEVNLIKFNSSNSFARISYYVIKMMNENRADVNLKSSVELLKEGKTQKVYSGKIGLSTWDTQAEFKDIQIIQDGVTVYKSDFVNNFQDWKTEKGKWEVSDSILSQKDEGAWPLAILNDKSYDTYVLKLKARKTGGYNAFMIPLALKDDKNYLRAHIGAWWNRVAGFELVSEGTDAMVSQPVNLKSPIETGKWYDIEIRVSNDKIECYLNGEFLMSYREPDKFFVLSGKDEKTGEIIVKAVNADESPMSSQIAIDGLDVSGRTGKAIILHANNPKAENSMDEPVKYVPREENFVIDGSSFNFEFKPYSVTILRIKPAGA